MGVPWWKRTCQRPDSRTHTELRWARAPGVTES